MYLKDLSKDKGFSAKFITHFDETPVPTDLDPYFIGTLGVIDTETTGQDSYHDKLLEIFIATVRYNKKTGEIYDKVGEFHGLQDPYIPIPEELTSIHGITNDMVKDKEIDWDKFDEIYGSCDVVLSHNAYFDRGFIDKNFPVNYRSWKETVWSCSIKEIPWPQRLFPSKRLSSLCLQHGFVFEHHKASQDVYALIQLIKQPNILISDGSPYFKTILDSVNKVLYHVLAVGDYYDKKERLKDYGFYWNYNRKVWYRLAYGGDEIRAIKAFLDTVIPNGGKSCKVEKISSYKRFT